MDEVTSYFGMRKIAIGKDDKGITRMMLNGKFVFQVGPLDQGFWPDGIYTAPTDEALRYDIETMQEAGLQLARKHVKVEPDRWYYWCDKLGLLVWQDMPAGDNRTAEAKQQFEAELRRLIEGRRNHPCDHHVGGLQRRLGTARHPALDRMGQATGPQPAGQQCQRLDRRECGDVIDMHNYPGPGSPRPDASRAAVLGEFGGLGLAVAGHTWSRKTWGYKGTQNTEDLTRNYEEMLRRAWKLKDKAGLSACIYTQIADMETECNGLLTYDREVNKVIPERAAAANSGKFPPPPAIEDRDGSGRH